MLYLVGLGLADETDITVKGLDVVKKAERVYLEAYTSILLVDKEQLVSVQAGHVQYPGVWLALMFSLISRKHTMGELLYWPTGRWSSHLVTQFSKVQMRLMWPS